MEGMGAITANLTVDGLEIPDDIIHTLDGFRAWAATLGEDGPRIHFYDGQVHIEMTPQSYKTHLPIISAINRRLGALAEKLDIGRYFEQGGWLTNEEAQLSTEPDGMLLLWETFTSGAARIQPNEIELCGRVDMVLEVVSKTSVAKDTVRLREGYARAGIPEFWLVDARDDRLKLKILTLRADRRYRESRPDAKGWRRSPVWRGSFKVSRSKDRLGLPRVELGYRPARA